MTSSASAVVLALFAIGVAAQQPPAQPPVKGAMPNLGRPTKATDEVPPLDFAGYFTGSWDFEWTVPETVLGPAGPVSGTTVYKAVGDSVYEADSKGEGPNGPFTITERFEYDKDKKLVRRRVTDSRGWSYTSTATVAGDLGGIYYLLYESEPFKIGSKTVRLKENVRLLSPFNYRVAMTVSEDGGAFANYGNPWWRKQVR
jgi:YD repeat-containing protein